MCLPCAFFVISFFVVVSLFPLLKMLYCCCLFMVICFFPYHLYIDLTDQFGSLISFSQMVRRYLAIEQTFWQILKTSPLAVFGAVKTLHLPRAETFSYMGIPKESNVCVFVWHNVNGGCRSAARYNVERP